MALNPLNARRNHERKGPPKVRNLGLGGDRLAELARLAVELQRVTEERHSRRALGAKR
jgi:hypothetical protein